MANFKLNRSIKSSSPLHLLTISKITSTNSELSSEEGARQSMHLTQYYPVKNTLPKLI